MKENEMDDRCPLSPERDAELRELIEEQTGLLANAAANASLQLLGMLGAYHGEVTDEYRLEVAKSLVMVLLAIGSVRACIEHAHGAMTDGERVGFIVGLVAKAFGMSDAGPIISELLADCAAGEKT